MADRDEAGRFQPGNKFWLARSSHGRNPKFETADQLADACWQYLEWVHDNPLYEDKLVTFQGAATHEPVAKMRAMTLGGLCLFIGVSFETWTEWRKSRPDFSEVMGAVELAIRQQKFEGAAADLLNANIIARDLGLADKAELTGKDGADLVPKPEFNETEIARRLAFLLASGMSK